MKTLDRTELKQWMDEDRRFVLVEALGENAYAEGHLPNAVRMGPEEVESMARTLIPHKDTTVVVYCAGKECDASTRVAERLEELGYKEVFDYPGGKEDWKAGDFPVEKGRMVGSRQ